MKFLEKLKNPLFPHILFLMIPFLLLFAVERLVLILTNLALFETIPLLVTLQSFIVGLRFDTSITLYALSFWFLITNISFWFKKDKYLVHFNAIYLTLCFFIYLFICVSEIDFFQYFQVRLNHYAISWEQSPTFVMKMIWESYPVIPYLILIFAICYYIFRYFLHIEKKFLKERTYSTPFLYKPIMFVVLGLLVFLGIRGTVSYKTPLRWGHAFYTSYNAANLMALNGIFTLFDEYIYLNQDAKILNKLIDIQDNEKANSIVSNLIIDSTGEYNHFPIRKYQYPGKEKKYNVVLILLESYGVSRLEEFDKMGIPLCLNRIKEEGLYFENFYSNGFHTYMGLFSTIMGLPNVWGKSILQRHEGQREFSGLSNILHDKGYTTYFGVPHDANFDNMAGFLKGNGIDEVIDEFDFNQSEVISTLGVPDHVLFERMHQKFKKSKQPFFGIMLSSTNHGPWIMPNIPGKKFHSTLHYMDWSLEYYLKLAAKERYFDNTIFIITADNGHPVTPIYDFDIQHTHIPFLIYNPKLIKPYKVKNIASQIDAEQIILGYLNMSYKTNSFGRNILKFPNEFKGYAVVQEGKMLGLIWNEWYMIDRIGESKPTLHRYLSDKPLVNYYDEKKPFADSLRNILRSYYFVGNDLILNEKLKSIKK